MMFDSLSCKLKKLLFLHESLDKEIKISHVSPVEYDDFYSTLRNTLITNEYEQFLKNFKSSVCIKISGWLQFYSVIDVVPFIETFEKIEAFEKVDV